jgi:predicted Fe-Mo cluster-binding NifX family protein
MGQRGLDDSVGEHFGRVPTYTMVNLETNNVKVIPNTSHHMGGEGNPPEIMAKENIDVMICQGLGRRAISMFESLGIEVYIGASGTVKDAIEKFQKGKLQKATLDNACGKHAFRDHHH